MRVVLAPDSFKESMSAARAAEAMAAGVRDVDPGATCVPVPMADGGEGLLAVLPGLQLRTVPLTGPLGDPVRAELGWWPERRLAVVESAQAVGVHLVPPAERRVLRADSGGVGTLIRAALDLGAERIVLGLGGTVTSDGGAGMLRELGAVLVSDSGEVLPPGVPESLARVDPHGLDPRLSRVQIEIAGDVRNPLLGPRGAAAVFAPQKGADLEQVRRIEAALTRMAGALDVMAGVHGAIPPGRPTSWVATTPGAGAAGGLGAALLALGARIRPGVELVAEAVDLAGAIRSADLVLTGEGRLDRQTLDGKVAAGVCRIAAGAGVPVVVLAGTVHDVRPADLGAAAVRPIADGLPLPEALARGPELLRRATAELITDRPWDPRPGPQPSGRR